MTLLPPHLRKDVEAAVFRHGDVQQNKVDLLVVQAEQLHGLLTAGRRHNVKVRFQQLPQRSAVPRGIVRDEYSLSSVFLHRTDSIRIVSYPPEPDKTQKAEVCFRIEGTRFGNWLTVSPRGQPL